MLRHRRNHRTARRAEIIQSNDFCHGKIIVTSAFYWLQGDKPMNALKEYDISQFKGMRELLVPLVIREIMKSRKVNDEEAFRLLYSSFLYSKLEIEATKLWHLSPCALCELLDEELRTGSITFPEEA
jgi:hypothetical protein